MDDKNKSRKIVDRTPSGWYIESMTAIQKRLQAVRFKLKDIELEIRLCEHRSSNEEKFLYATDKFINPMMNMNQLRAGLQQQQNYFGPYGVMVGNHQ